MINTLTSLLAGIAFGIAGFFGYQVQHETPAPAPTFEIHESEPTERITADNSDVTVYVPEDEPIVSGFNPTGGGTYRLQSSISTTDTSITLSSFKEPVSNIKYTMSYLNSDIGYGTLEPGNSTKSEFVSFSGITQNGDGTATLTGVLRGLTRTPAGSSCTASTTLASTHSGQSIFILSDSPCLFANYAVKSNNETITGQWTFSTFPITPSNGTSSVNVAGVSQLATPTQQASSTATSTNGTLAPLVLSAQYATSSYNSATAGNKVVVTKNNGKIDQNFIDLSSYTGAFSAATTSFSGNLTLTGSATSTIASSSMVVFTSSGTWTKPANFKYAVIEVVGGGGGGGAIGASANAGAAGGGGGGYCKKIVEAVRLGATETVTIGAAGAAGTGSNAGGAGGNTSFGSHCTGNGGAGGGGSSGGSFVGGDGGTATGGDINISGGPGMSGSLSAGSSGKGGDSILGYGGKNVITDNGGIGGSLYGGGGSGAFCDASCSASNGGGGAAGVVIVTQYFY